MKLHDELIKLSSAKVWELSRYEWLLDYITINEMADETCLCGHYPIKELCHLKNRINNSKTIVGNCCVRQFLGLDLTKVFTSVKNITKNKEKSPNKELIFYANNKKIITGWEFNFLNSIVGKRKLSTSQMEYRKNINSKILSNIVKRREDMVIYNMFKKCFKK
jgi:hypothetical protein